MLTPDDIKHLWISCIEFSCRLSNQWRFISYLDSTAVVFLAILLVLFGYLANRHAIFSSEQSTNHLSEFMDELYERYDTKGNKIHTQRLECTKVQQR